ncbi:unnamed protein product [Mytilus coruscus]|uniref:Reverse transcriptase domain-containing protein n=1 Tax=Mytilus coruscus TaxID=42192 RepID=A0A6J8CC05_MYTCO|nr:unnamed protein product [Mytilus coruscus]
MYNVNVCALSEHWLRTYQLHVLDSIDNNYICIAKGTDERNPELLTCKGRSGVAFLISKDIYPFTSLIEVNSDRIIGIEVNIPNSEKYRSPVQADDISLIATNHESAREIVSICEQYCESWSFSFSPAKSKLLQFSKKLIGPDIFLYNEPIVPVKSATHVGISLDTSMKTMDRTLKACRTLRATTASVIRSGIHPAVLNPKVCAKIIRQVCYPKALYGCEIWGKLSKTETLMLERTHHYVCKFHSRIA